MSTRPSTPKPNLTIDAKISGLFERLSGWDFEELKRDIAKNGVRIPIEISQDNVIIDGHKRFKAWIELHKDLSKLPMRRRTYATRKDMVDAALGLNLLRRHLTNEQRAWIAYKHFLPEERRRARERQATSTGGSRPQLTEIVQEADGESLDLAAKRVGLSGRTLRKAEMVFKGAPKKLIGLVLDGTVSINQAHNELRKINEYEEKSCESLKSAHKRGEISFEKAIKIASLDKQSQPVATKKVVEEQLSSKETALLVQTLLNEPDRKEEILATSINELTPAPPEVREFVKEYGAEERMFKAGRCPRCDLEYKIDWTLHTIWWEEDSDE